MAKISGSTHPTPADELELAKAIDASLVKANELNVESIAIPMISSGIFGYPKNLTADVLVASCLQFLNRVPHASLQVVNLVALDGESIGCLRHAAVHHKVNSHIHRQSFIHTNGHNSQNEQPGRSTTTSACNAFREERQRKVAEEDERKDEQRKADERRTEAQEEAERQSERRKAEEEEARRVVEEERTMRALQEERQRKQTERRAYAACHLSPSMAANPVRPQYI